MTKSTIQPGTEDRYEERDVSRGPVEETKIKNIMIAMRQPLDICSSFFCFKFFLNVSLLLLEAASTKMLS